MTTDNPYSAPVAASDDVATTPDQSLSLGQIARSTFWAWEKLRLVFIAVLAALTLLLGSSQWNSLDFWMIAVEGAIAVNLCYFAGPIVETYVTWLGLRGRWLRPLLFLMGLFFSCLLVVAQLAASWLPAPL
jgi:hypothetical protein